MKRVLFILLLLGCLLPSRSARAQAVAVTVSLDTNVLTVSSSTLLHVRAQIVPALRSTSDRIFSWYVDVLNTNGLAVSANYGAMLKSASDNDPSTSSKGTTQGANLHGVYDTFLNLPGAGKDTPVELMTIPVTGLSTGKTRFLIQPGTTVPGLSTDFLVAPAGGGDPMSGGSYAGAFADLTVIKTTVTTPVVSVTPTNSAGQTQFIIHYGVLPGFDYYVEYEDALGSAAGWQIFPGGPYDSGVYTDKNPPPTRFYRVLVVPQGFFQVRLSITPTNSGPNSAYLLQYPVQPGFDYYLQGKAGVGAAGWQTLPAGPHNSGAVLDGVPAGSRFYRALVVPHGTVLGP